MTKGTKILITILSILVVGGGATVGIVVLPQMFVKESIIEKFDICNQTEWSSMEFVLLRCKLR